MFIKKVQLDNITTHKKTIIEFQDGINVLAGSNGSGKSSVLNMIGFVLFDNLPGKTQKEYIRMSPENPKSGRIRVWFVGNDNDEYCVERQLRVNGSGTYTITHVESGQKLSDLDKKEDKLKWLQEQLGITQEIDLKKIFQNAVGVHQGTFTEPFLRTGKERRDFFDPLLNVDIYNKIFNSYLDIIHEFDSDLDLYQNQIERLEGELSNKEEILKEQNETKNQLTHIRASIQSLVPKLKSVEEEYSQLKNLKKNLDVKKTQVETSQITLENLRKDIVNKKSELDDANKSLQVCTTTKESFSRFEKLLELEKELQQKYNALLKYKEQKNVFEQKIIELQTHQSNFAKRIDEIETRRDELPQLKENFTKYQRLQALIDKFNDKKIMIHNKEKELIRKKSKKEKLELILNEIRVDSQILEKLKGSMENLEPTREELHALKLQQSLVEKELKENQENKRATKGGMCPFLNAKCQNLEGKSLEEYFNSLIRKNEQKIVEFGTVIEKLKVILTKCQNDEKKYRTLNEQAIKASEQEKQLFQIQQEIEEYEKELVGKELLERKLSNAKKEFQNLEPTVKEYQVLANKFEKELPALSNELKHFSAKLPPIQKALKSVLEEMELLSSVPKQIEHLQTEKSNLREDHNLYQINYNSAQKVEPIKKQLQRLVELHQTLIAKFQILQEEYKNLLNQFNLEKFEQLDTNRQVIREQLGQQKGLLTRNEDIFEKNQKKITQIALKEKILAQKFEEKEELEQVKTFSIQIRNWFKEAGPKVTDALLNNINILASELFQKLIGNDAIQLVWTKDYDVEIITAQNTKFFHQLSGGEQMSAALAIRLAILKILTSVDFAFFDEPTTNLDTEKRQNLARCIQNIRGFRQLFVISHDDTFEENADNVIHFEKTEKEETNVEYTQF